MSNSVKRLGVYAEVEQERLRQDERWGGPDHDDEYIPRDWWGFIRKQWEDEKLDTRETFIRIAALAVAAVEAYDRIPE